MVHEERNSLPYHNPGIKRGIGSRSLAYAAGYDFRVTPIPRRFTYSNNIMPKHASQNQQAFEFGEPVRPNEPVGAAYRALASCAATNGRGEYRRPRQPRRAIGLGYRLPFVDPSGVPRHSQHDQPSGQPVNAVYGFTRDLFNLLETKQPDFLFCAFDLPGKTFRHEHL